MFQDATAPSTTVDDSSPVRSVHNATSLEEAYAARNALAERFLPLARIVAANTVPRHLRHHLDDCEQEAACALLEVAARVDMPSEEAFASYAYSAMRNRVRSYLRTEQPLTRSESLGRKITKLRRTFSDDEVEQLSDSAVAQATGLSRRSVRNLRPWLNEALSCDAIDEFPDDRGGCLSADDVEAGDACTQLRRLLPLLNPKDAFILRKVFGLDGDEPATIRDAVGVLGFSPQRGAMRLRRALRVLRTNWRD